MRYASPSTFYGRWAQYLIKHYPASWRERYAEEMLLMLEDYPPTLKTIINLYLHMLDAYAHQNLVKERSIPMWQKMRSNELNIYSAAVIFFLVWFLAGTCAAFLIGVPRIISIFSMISSVLYLHSQYIFWGVPLLILFGALPILLATSWKALQTRKPVVLLFLLLGPICPSVTLFLILSFHVWISLTGIVVACIISLGMSVAFIRFAVQSVTPSRRVTHFVLYFAIPFPLLMLFCFTSFLLDLLDNLTIKTIISSMHYDYVIYSLCGLILIMLASVSFSFISLFKGFQARRAIQDTL